MDRTNYSISQSSLRKIAVRRDKDWVFILVLLVLISMGCIAGEWVSPFSIQFPGKNKAPEFTPFTPADCNVGDSFPAPDAASMHIYPMSIYCPFMPGGNLHGTVFLTLEYIEDPANSAYANMQKTWNDTFQSLKNIVGATVYSLLEDPPTQSVIVVIKDTEPGAQDMTADLLDLILYKDHFIIYISGGETVTSEADASALDLELIKYAEATADSHYK